MLGRYPNISLIRRRPILGRNQLEQAGSISDGHSRTRHLRDISLSFPKLFLIQGQVVHVLLSCLPGLNA